MIPVGCEIRLEAGLQLSFISRWGVAV
jgi:hypothetical protein